MNIRLFIYAYKSFHRVSPQTLSSQITTRELQRQNSSHHGVRLLIHTICMFVIFVIGWSPFYFGMIFLPANSAGKHSRVILITWALTSLYVVIICLFIYNIKLREYLKNKIFPCC